MDTLATLILFSQNDQLTSWQDDRDFVELVFIPYDDKKTGCNCRELYEMIG